MRYFWICLAGVVGCGGGGDGGETGTPGTSGGSAEQTGTSAEPGPTTTSAPGTTTQPETTTTNSPTSTSGTSGETGDDTTGGGVTPVLLTMTLHLEGMMLFDADYFAALDAFAATFEAHGGKLTFEPRDNVVNDAVGIFDWRELEKRGHSIGSHAGIGGPDPIDYDLFKMQATMRFNNLAKYVDRLDHVSGACGQVDWITALSEVGFKAATASTVLCLYSMAEADRPDPYKMLDCADATDPLCHQSYPKDLPKKLHPWRALDGSDWLTDSPDGKLVIFPGSGTLPCLTEEAQNPNMLSNCTFNNDDIDLALADLDAAIAAVDPDQINTFYWVWGNWSIEPAEEPVLAEFLGAIDERVAAGTVQWANVGEMLDAYEAKSP